MSDVVLGDYLMCSTKSYGRSCDDVLSEERTLAWTVVVLRMPYNSTLMNVRIMQKGWGYVALYIRYVPLGPSVEHNKFPSRITQFQYGLVLVFVLRNARTE